jgi:hypothetical protein
MRLRESPSGESRRLALDAPSSRSCGREDGACAMCPQLGVHCNGRNR